VQKPRGKHCVIYSHKDKWWEVELTLDASGLAWESRGTGGTLRDAVAGSHNLRATDQLVSTSPYSILGMAGCFEVVSTVKGGNVYKFSAGSDADADAWVAALEQTIDAHGRGGGILLTPEHKALSSAEPNVATRKAERGARAVALEAVPAYLQQNLDARPGCFSPKCCSVPTCPSRYGLGYRRLTCAGQLPHEQRVR
jgi:hypothetical protein